MPKPVEMCSESDLGSHTGVIFDQSKVYIYILNFPFTSGENNSAAVEVKVLTKEDSGCTALLGIPANYLY